MSQEHGNPSPLHPVMLLATGFGLGMARLAPGTMGTLLGIPITVGLSFIPSLMVRIGVLVLGCGAGVAICGAAAKRLGQKDPSSVVWDEFATLPMVYLGLPVESWRNPVVLACGFLLHRLFDISKLPPINLIERLPRGWGIMLDDVFAAGYAGLCVVLLDRLGFFVWLQP